MTYHFLDQLRAALAKHDRPGSAAQAAMAPFGRRETLKDNSSNSRKAAVLALFYPANNTGDLNLIFIQRSSNDPRDRHAGQIGFPGGSVELQDVDLEATALRETYEEIGVPPDSIEVLGRMTDLYIPVSNFTVSPFVGYTKKRPQYKLQTNEVAALLEVPMSDFFKETARQIANMKLASGASVKNVPFWQVGGHQIWGATAMMVSEIIALLPPSNS